MPELSKRAITPEIMDDLMIAGPDLHQALRELDTINYALGGNYVTLNGVCQLLEKHGGQEIHIVDLGCGSGDMLKGIRSLLERRRTSAVLTGIDANPNVIAYATNHTPARCRVRYEAMNIFSKEFARQKFDIVTATLFFHHFTDDELIHFFSALKFQVRRGLVINDIHRHWFAYYSIKWLTRIFSRSAMVKNDAPLSVMRGFRRHELKDILEKAGLVNYRIKWCWAFRWQVVVPVTTDYETLAGREG